MGIEDEAVSEAVEWDLGVASRLKVVRSKIGDLGGTLERNVVCFVGC